MPARPLFKAAVTACIKNIRSITDVGDVGYEVVRPVLAKIDNPEQLRQIEITSPQICGPDGDLWLEFIKRDIPNWNTKPHTPRNPKSWYKVYKKLLAETKKEVDEDAVLLKAELDRIKQEQAKNTIKTVELNVYKVPEGLKPQGPTLQLTRKAQFQDKVYRPPPEPRIRDSDSDPDEPTHQSPGYPGHSIHPGRAARQYNSTTRTNPPQKSKLDKIRKEVKANSLFQHHNRNQRPEMKLNPVSTNKVIATDKITTTNRIISTNKNRVKAPSRFVAEYQNPALPQPLDPSIKPPAVFAPKRARMEPEQSTAVKRESRHLPSATKSTSVSHHSEYRTASPLPHADEPLPSVETPKIATLLAAVRETSTSPPTHVLNTSDPTQTTTKTVLTPNNGIVHPPRRESPYVKPRVNTSSPSRSGVRPPMQIKRKQPVDIFMRPTKRQKAA